MASCAQVVLLVLLVSEASASHYYGNTVSFSSKGRNTDGSFRVEVRSRSTFRSCHHSNSWSCHRGNCGVHTEYQSGTLDWSSNAPGNSRQWCETEAIQMWIIPSDKPFQLREASCCWITTRSRVGSWNLLASVDLGVRSDTGKPNSSPDIAILPFLRIPQNCPRTYKLMTFDPDGDLVQCRYGSIGHAECSSCRTPSGFHLDQASCSLQYRHSYTHPHVYGFEMVVEDFPKEPITLVYTDGSRTSRTPPTIRRRRRVILQNQTTTNFTTVTPHSTTTRPWWWRPTTRPTTTTPPWWWHLTTRPKTTTPPWWWHLTTRPTTTTRPWWWRPTTRPTTTTPPWWWRPTTRPTTTTPPWWWHLTTRPKTTTPPWWWRPTTRPTTTTRPWWWRPTTRPTTTTRPWWWRPTTRPKTTTPPWWWRPTTQPTTTTRPWWWRPTTRPTTTTRPWWWRLTTRPTTTTPPWWWRPTTRPTTTTRPWWWRPTTRPTTTTRPWWWRPTTRPTTTTRPWWWRPTTRPMTTTPPWWWRLTTRPTTTAPPWWWRPTTRPTTTTPPWSTRPTTHRLHPTSPPLSKLPLQFSFLVDPPVSSCHEGHYLPRLLPPTPKNGASIEAEVDKEVEIRVRAHATYSRIYDVILSGPLNISKHRTAHDQFAIRWTPTADHLDQHRVICFAVESMNGSSVFQSEMRCVVVDISKERVKSHVICNQSSMTVEVERSLFPGLSEDRLQLAESSNTICSLRRLSNSSHIIAVIPLNACGTQIEEDDEHLMFKNEIMVDNTMDLVTRKDLLEVQFYCQYPKRANVTLGYSAHRKNVTVWEKGFGTFTFQFELYPNSRFDIMMDPDLYPLEYDLGSQIFMQIEASSSVNNTQLFVESCRAAPYDNPNYHPTYSIIENGCTVDQTVQIHPPAHGRQFRFSLEAFKFIGLHDQVYISCSVLLCEAGVSTRCSQGCIRSGNSHSRLQKRQAVVQSSPHLISQGPVRLRRSAGVEGETGMKLNLNLVFISGCLLAALGMLSAVAVYRARLSKVKYQPLPTREG